VTTAHLGDNPDVVAFYSLKITLEDERLLAPANPLKDWAAQRVFPSLHLEWLAVAEPFQGKKIGTVIMGRVLETFRDAVLETGLPVLTLVPINERVRTFYAGLGFDAYAAHKGRRNMMLPAQSVLDMYEKAKS
jgi:GNAT superfamily N-acetyltransferase